jgi:hypothetical protein
LRAANHQLLATASRPPRIPPNRIEFVGRRHHLRLVCCLPQNCFIPFSIGDLDRQAVLVYCKDTKQIDLILRDGFLGCWNEKRSSTSDLVAFTADTAENQLTLFRKTLWLDWN